jgi:methylmalonyl-CoA mutase N-terminal domain/subunit
MRQYAGFSSAEESNQRYREILKAGGTGLSVAFDLPTQMGIDPDSDLAIGEVGKVGVSLASVEEMAILLKGIDLSRISLSMTINATAQILNAYLIVLAKERGISWKILRGTTQNDILKEHIARGTYIFSPEIGFFLAVELIEEMVKIMPSWYPISISGYHIREAGATADQEIAFTISNGLAYLEALRKRNVKIEEVLPRLSFFFNVQIDIFEEVAKFRAARRLWAKSVKQNFKIKDNQLLKMRFHSQTAGSSLTSQQPYNNLTRTAIEALAAVMGGAQSLHTNGFDEALGLPSKKSAELALRTQQIIAYESGAANIADPLAGSYLIEELTDQLEARATKIIKDLGDPLLSISQGRQRKMIEASAYQYQKALEDKKRMVVGVNCFCELKNEMLQGDKPQAIDKQACQRITKRVKALKKGRSKKEIEQMSLLLSKAAEAHKGVFQRVREAAAKRMTVGEIISALKLGFGEAK